MREIKFKYIFQQEETGRTMTRVFDINEIENALGNTEFRRYTVIDRLQFTGLKDKNDKEIYEGDIVKHQNKETIGTVIFQKTGFTVWEKRTNTVNGKKEGIANYLDDVWEVIGNIYENPSLLSEEDGRLLK